MRISRVILLGLFVSFWVVAPVRFAGTGGVASAFHFPWDQGHDTFTPDPGDGDNDPGDDDCNNSGSPFEVQTGNFIHKREDVFIRGLGLSLDITRTYNSLDRRNGPFGRGWAFTYDQRLIGTTDGLSLFAICRQGSGKRERYSRNADGSYTGPRDIPATLEQLPDGSFVVTNKDGLVRTFDGGSRLETIADRYGNRLTFDYDPAGFLSQITGAAGQSLLFTKGPNGKISGITDPAGRDFLYDYDTDGNLTGFTDPAGNSTQYVYDSVDRLVQIIDPRGHSVQEVSYDSSGRVATFKELDETWTVDYFPGQNKTTKRDSSGRTWTFFYNDNGNIVQRLNPLGTTRDFSYTADFNVSSATDRNGNVTQFTYDAVRNPLSRTDALGNESQFTYEPRFNQVTTATDPLGRITAFSYDSLGNLVSITDPLGNVSTSSYDAKGQLTATTDALGNQSSLIYDANGYLTGIVGPLGSTTSLAYDLLGNVTSIVNSIGRQIAFEYDAHQVLNQPVRVIDGAGGVTEIAYDENGNVISRRNPNGDSTLFEYDAHDRLTRVTNALGFTEVFTYDSKGNLIARTDPKGQSFSYSYDAENRLLVESTLDNVISYSYDGEGNLLSVTDNDSALSFSYDALNRLITVQTGATVAQPATTVTYSYDAVGNRATMTDPTGGVTSYTYDALGLMTQLTNPDGEVTVFAYDPISRLKRKGLANGATSTWTYDGAGRVVNVAHDITGIVSSFAYTYDAAANRISATETAGSSAYSYDAANRLTSASHPQAENPPEVFTYDPSGNRLTSHLSSAYAYDAANQLLRDDTYRYSYDAGGNQTARINLTTGDTTTYSYDAKDQLIAVGLPAGSVVNYRYDGLGRRIGKSSSAGVVRYVYDDEDILFEYDGSDAALVRYTHGPGIDQPISQTRSIGSFYYHADSVGSVREISDESGAVVESYVYDSFGQIVSETGAVDNPYTFTGREVDRESGLLFYRARHYDPSTGRFLQQDPLASGGGTNFYAYALNDPVNHIDPFGLYGTRDCSYYQKQCKLYNGTYYCKWAPTWCKRFKPLDGLHWTRCVRKCLQDYDDKNCSPGQSCTDPGTESRVKDCNWKGHYFCYAKCAKDPGTDPNTGKPNPNISPAGLFRMTVANIR